MFRDSGNRKKIQKINDRPTAWKNLFEDNTMLHSSTKTLGHAHATRDIRIKQSIYYVEMPYFQALKSSRFNRRKPHINPFESI